MSPARRDLCRGRTAGVYNTPDCARDECAAVTKLRPGKCQHIDESASKCALLLAARMTSIHVIAYQALSVYVHACLSINTDCDVPEVIIAQLN